MNGRGPLIFPANQMWIGSHNPLSLDPQRLRIRLIVWITGEKYSRINTLSKAVVTNEGRLKYRDVVKLIEADGWFWVRTNGSHQIYHHPTKLNIVVVPAHNMGRDVKPGLAHGILKQAGLR